MVFVPAQKLSIAWVSGVSAREHTDKTTKFFLSSVVNLASHADVLGDSSGVPAPQMSLWTEI